MDYGSAYDLVSRTYGDQLHGTATFDLSGGGRLRVEIDIDGDAFRVIFRHSDGISLVVTPGSAVAQNGATIGASALQTGAALGAWKSQPPLSLAPLTAGLAQLASPDPVVAKAIAFLAGSNGSLAFGFFPSICWYTALYPKVSLPGLELQKLVGRVCLRDVTFSTSRIGFRIDIHAECEKVLFQLGSDFSLALDTVHFEGHVSADLDLSKRAVDGEVFRLLLDAKGNCTGTLKSAMSTPALLLGFPRGFYATVADLKVAVSQKTGGPVVTRVDNGPLSWKVPEMTVADCTITPATDAKIVATGLKAADAGATMTFRSDKAGKSTASGSFHLGELSFKADFAFPQVDASGFSGSLALLQAEFGPDSLHCLSSLRGKADALKVAQSDSQLSLVDVEVAVDADFRGKGAAAPSEVRLPRLSLRLAGKKSDAAFGALSLEKFGGGLSIRDAYLSAAQSSFSAESVGLIEATKARVRLGVADLAEFETVTLNLSAAAESSGGTAIVRVNSCGLDSPSGIVKYAGFVGKGVASGAQVRDLVVVDKAIAQGRATVALYPAAGNIPVDIPSPIDAGQVRLDTLTNGSFKGLGLTWEQTKSAPQPVATLALLDGAVDVGTVGLNIDGKRVDLKPDVGPSFHVVVSRLEHRIFPRQSPSFQISAYVANATQLSVSSVQIGDRTLSFKIKKVKVSAWSVGEFDGRVAAQLDIQDGVLSGAQGLVVQSAVLRLLSDEYLYRQPNSRAINRHLFADLNLIVGGIPRKIDSPWDTGELPADEEALLAYLKAHVSSGALKTVISLLQAANTFPLGIEVQLYIRFAGSASIEFKPALSSFSKLVFQGKATVDTMQVIAKVVGRIGICPFCVEKVIKTFKVDLPASHTEAVEITLTLNYDSVTNTITVSPFVTPLAGVLSIIAAWLADWLIGLFNLSISVNLPPDIRPKSLGFREVQDKVEILLGVTADKIEWS